MNATGYRVRRATLDDMPALAELWRVMRLDAEALTKRVTEFQVAEGTDGTILGTVAFQMSERQGRIHSECFGDFALADRLRPLFWDRFHALSTNHGLFRLWTQEKAPFWSHSGMQPAGPDAMDKLPLAWRELGNEWLTIKLKDDIEAVLSADKEFALFMESEKQRTQRAFQQAKVLKMVAVVIAFGLIILVFAAAFFLMRNNPRLLGR